MAGSPFFGGKCPNRTSTKKRSPFLLSGKEHVKPERVKGQATVACGMWSNSVGQRPCPWEGGGQRECAAPGCVSLATAAAMRQDNCWEIVLFCCFVVFSVLFCFLDLSLFAPYKMTFLGFAKFKEQ